MAHATTVATPTFSLTAGTYTGAQSVTISDSTSGSTIYYTTNGTTPTTSSTKYTGAITVNASETLKALATATGDTNSAIGTATYTLVAEPPVFSLPGASYLGFQTVTISDLNSAATIYYTTDGTTPTTSSTLYTGAISVSSTETLEALAVISGYTNSAVATVTYTITTSPGTLNIYLSPPGVQSTTVSGATTETFDALSTGVYDTTYVSTAGLGTYTGSATQPFTIMAPGEFGGSIDSSSTSPTNYFAAGQVGPSAITDPVTLSLAQPASYFGFWWSAAEQYNRVALYSGSTLYGVFSTADLLGFLNNGAGTISALNGTSYQTNAYFGDPNITSGTNDSGDPFAYISFAVTGPTITQITFYNTPQTASGFSSDNHSVIFSGNTVTIPTTFVPVESLTLGSQVAMPVFTPQGTPLTVAITSSTPGASINYTTNGTPPTSTAGTAYTGPISVSQTETIEAIAFETGMTASTVASATYTIPILAVTSSSNPSTYGGTVTFTATISSGPTGTVIFYNGGIAIGTGTISGTTATFTTTSLGAGAHTITASWPGNASYGSVLSASITQTVNVATQTISFAPPSSPVTYGVSPIALTATGGASGNPITFSVISGPGSVSGNTLTITGAGTVVVAANQAGNVDYAAAAQVTQSVVVNQAVPTITFSVSNQTYGVAPFAVSASSNSSGSITYSVVSGPATISGSIVTIAGAGTVVLQASQVASGNYTAGTEDASFIVNGLPVSITVSPTTATLSANQTEQFTATVSNTGNTAVAWAISPVSVGTISASGLYTAPASISGQQTVTVTATSQADTTKAASATVSLTPPQCGPSGYGYSRAVVIDHTKVPNTDQANFPIVFSATDATFANTAYGGHVSSANGYDIIFASDPGGLNILNSELEEYDPIHGQVIEWVQIPSLSHSVDTLIYVFYGNPNITASQQTPGAAWDSNYVGVWHVANNGGQLSLSDSTSNGNNATNNGATSTTGQIDGGMQTNGSTYATVGTPASLANLAQGNATFSAWVNSAVGAGGRIMAKDDNNNNAGWALGLNSSNKVEFLTVYSGADFRLTSSATTGNGTWSYVTVTSAGNPTGSSQASIYINGIPVATGSGGSGDQGNDSAQPAYLANATYGDQASAPFNGTTDEFRISKMIRSADWIATEYNNQRLPSLFYKLYPENAVAVVPATTSLYASQSQQFALIGTCSSAVTWSMSSGASGTLTAGGLYTAPSTITSQQTLEVTATDQANPATVGSSVVTLLPPAPPIALIADVPSPYMVGSSQGFIATLKDQNGVPQAGIPVTFTVTGVNSVAGSATTDASGIASYSYVGANVGSDTVVATATINGQQYASNSVAASWIAAVPVSGQASVALVHPSLGISGLCGAFTDASGTVIEPIPIGATASSFVVPAGASQLQLGIDDNVLSDNVGTGYVVETNGVVVTVPPTARPWNWAAGGLNASYAFGVNDGTSPIVALTNLTPGAAVSVAYQTGTVSSGTSFPYVNANGDQGDITGITSSLSGIYFPTLYMTGLSYTVGQSAAFTALVTDGSGAPLPNTDVMLNIVGANARQFQATTNSSGIAAFAYTGLVAGIDTVNAEAYPSGGASLASGSNTVTWVNSAIPPLPASLVLSPDTVQPLPANGQQSFTVYATDASGTPVPNATVSLVMVGQDNFQLTSTTNSSGYANFVYQDRNPGITFVVAIGMIDNAAVFSNEVKVPWTLPPTTSTTTGGNGSTINIGIDALSTVTLPNTLQLNGTVTDSSLPAGTSPTIAWSQVSGPGTVTFTTPQQAVTSAAFSQAGDYVVELSANDSTSSGSLQFPVTVNPVPGTVQGWVGSPIYGSTVNGIVPITLASGIALQSGILAYYPANNPNSVTTLNGNTTGSGQIGTLDTTMLANGSYWIQLQATDTSGEFEYSMILVTVAGNYKPGRVTATVTDLVVPATGLPINIQRTYDSLNASTSGDFGYGWNLGINVNLSVDPAGDVTFTLGGQRRTFYLTPEPNGFLPYDDVIFTPEPGFAGTLTDSQPGCADYFDFVVPDGSLWLCIDGGQYNPPGYIYTDPNGTSYLMSAGGALKAIQDRSGNGLTITANGITSSTGLNVPFVRDGLNRITQITDPNGNIYSYTYDSNGNLATVTYPNTAQPSTYTYDTNHLYLSGTDFRNNPLPTSTYYTATDTDPNGLPLNGRLQSVTDGLGETTSYAYNLTTNTTTVTYPPDASGNVGTATMVYDGYGMLLSSTDPLGEVTTNVYDAKHNLTSVTDPLGHVNAYTYDQNGNKTSSTYPATPMSSNTTSTTAYNQYSEPTSTTDELGNVRSFNYDANYDPRSVTDSSGTLASFLFNANQTLQAGAIGFDITASPANASQFTYDANGNMIGRTDALGRTTSYVYNSLGQKTSTTEPTPTSPIGSSASTTNYTYDQLGNLTQTAAPLSRTTSSTYDGNGNKITDTDARGNVTGYQYDSLNRLIETDYPTSTRATRTYDFRNNVISETDQDGNVTRHTYDLSGRQVSVTRGYGTSSASTTSYAYDSAGRKIGETDALGHTTTYTFDADSRLVAIAGVKGNFTYTYDDAGNRIAQTDANNNKTQFQYDARKRLTVTTYPDGTTTANTYDGPGNLHSVTDQAGNQVQYTYDAANQLKTVVQAASPNTSNNTNSYGYDNLGNLSGLMDENLHTTQNSFDLFNEPVSKILPDGTLTETRNYDAAGNLTSLTHFNGVTTSYTYDTLNRLLTRTTPGESTVSFTYTPTGKYLSSTAGDGTVNYSYDSLDRLTTKATPEGTLSYTYYPTGKVETIVSSNPNGASVAYTYDDLNRLSTVADNRLPGNNTTTYTYDPASNLATATYPNGLQSTFTYDPLNRLTAMATPVSSYSYTLGPTGNRTAGTEGTGRTLNWSYDGIYRLTNEAVSADPDTVNGSIAYGLDPVGNRLSKTSSVTGVNSGSFGYNADDEVSSETYDNNGNTLSTGGKTFAYDSENHLTSMNGGAVSIVYDAFGNRVAKTVNGITTKYLVEDDVNPTGYPQVLDELTNGVVTCIYTYGLQRISQDQIVEGAWTPSVYGYDGEGSVRQLTNSAGAVTDTYNYDAFGNLLNSTGTTPNNYLYRGEQYDPDLGLYYLRARYYNPLTGRFMSRDPEDGKAKDPKTLHKYLYAGGDPVNAKDPTGRGIVSYAIELGEDIKTVTALRLTGYAVCVEVTTLSLFIEDSPPPDWPEIVMAWCASALNW
jgi:RHS repeat-associated protein